MPLSLINNMTLEEKIAQKIMLDFRHWHNDDEPLQDLTEPNPQIENLITQLGIGGVILFANNLKHTNQIKALTSWLNAIETRGSIRLFIAIDNEGGNVFRLPRHLYSPFPGNMALAAAIEGGADPRLAFEQGKQMALELRNLHINTNFSPVVDINVNPKNPVINVRAFSDDVDRVCLLAQQMTVGMRSQGLITAYKHFPGHGNTEIDSHLGLPCVNSTREMAFQTDLAPYKKAIELNVAPEMIMTAHIQYPSLDNQYIKTRNNHHIYIPATMSYAIQTQLLREELGYQGVTISDALDMGAIATHFTPEIALENVFKAGVDIALMPLSFSNLKNAACLTKLIKHIVNKVHLGEIREQDINTSLERILLLKERQSLINETENKININENKVIFSSKKNSVYSIELQKNISNKSTTIVINNHNTLPLKNKNKKYLIITPWLEQAEAINLIMKKNGYKNISYKKENDITFPNFKEKVLECDILLLGTLSTSFSPVENENNDAESQHKDATANTYFDYFTFARQHNKTCIHLSLRAPYDIPIYSRLVDATVATYAYYGNENGDWHGQEMISLTEILIGNLTPHGKLPVNLGWNNDDEKINEWVFQRGFGLKFC